MTEPVTSAVRKAHSRLIPLTDRLSKVPYWLLAIALCGVAGLWIITANADYRVILKAASTGMLTTIYVSVSAYFFSVLFGLFLGLMRVSAFRIFREAATFWVEIVRGIPNARHPLLHRLCRSSRPR